MKKNLVILLIAVVIVFFAFFFQKDKPSVEYTVNMEGELIAESNGTEEVLIANKNIDFYKVSPDGKYIVYSFIEKYISCCGGENNVPVDSFWIYDIKSKASSEVEKPSSENIGNRELARFKKWSADSSGILVYFQYPDEATQGSDIYKTNLKGEIVGVEIETEIPALE